MSFDATPHGPDEIPPDRRPSPAEALVPVLGLVCALSTGLLVFDLDPQFPLLWSIVFTGIFGRFWLGYPWSDLSDGMADALRGGMQAVLILFVVYALVATWVAAGTIPSLMYYGLELLSPRVFLPATAIVAGVISFTVGSSLTTAGTVGVAFVGIGSGLGLPAPMTAGAVLSGAYAGDKQSPLSDTTNLAAAVTDTDLYDHVNAMKTGTAVAFGASLLLYAALGLHAGGALPAERIATIRNALTGAYAVTPWTFLPLVVTFGLAIRGVPALPSLVAGQFTGAATAVVVQGVGFTRIWRIAQSGLRPRTGNRMVNDLLRAGGLVDSAWVVTIVVAALALGGLLSRTGVLAVLAAELAERSESAASVIAATLASAVSMNALAAEQHMSIVVPGMTFRGVYEEYGLDSATLSQSVEAAGTTTSALIPWNSGGVFMASTLGVATLQYAPYYFFGLLSPLVALGMAVVGWNVRREPYK